MRTNLDLAVIGNCQVAALVDRLARIVWMCLPRPDGDPVFAELLNGDAGANAAVFSIELEGQESSVQRYIARTAVLETVLSDGNGGAVRVTDFCPRFHARDRMFRPVGLIRIVEVFSGRPVVRFRLQPRMNHGCEIPEITWGSSHVRFTAGGYPWRVTTDASVQALIDARAFVLDRKLTLLMGPDEPVSESVGRLGHQFLEDTVTYWRDWVRGLAIPFEWQDAVIRAAITLKLCTFEDTGAILAALTTSIPESANSGRNWDYRFCWLRDAHFTIRALNRLGATQTMESYLHFMDNMVALAEMRPIHPLYTLTGAPVPVETVVQCLPGYRGMGPVRFGNEAREQIQHDVYGSLVLALTQAFFDQRLSNPGNTALFKRLERFGEKAWEFYDQPDAGIWEYRGIQRCHTFSALMCWAATDRLSRLAGPLGLPENRIFWRERADKIASRILRESWSDELRTFTGAFGVPTLDASCLLMAELGFISPADDRFIATVEAIERHLTKNRLLMRYRDPDDFGEPENAFTICTFWYINALAAIGRRDEARELFEHVLTFRNAMGLLSEDIDPHTGELWGNFPQTYSMVGIIDCALRLSRSWEEAL